MAIIQTPSIAAVVEDQTPQLGGNLDCQDYQLQWSGSSQFIGSLVATAGLNISSGSNNIQLTSNGIIDINTNGASRAKFEASGGLSVGGAVAPLSVDSFYDLGTTSLRWNTVYADSLTIGDGVDAILTADGANELALKNSTNAQAFHVYNTDDGVNYERLEVKWDTNVAYVGPTQAGTGSGRDMVLTSGRGTALGHIELDYSSGFVRFKTSAATTKMYVGALGTRINDSLAPNVDSDADATLGETNLRFANTYTDTITIGNGVDAILTADAADELALRNGTNAQQLNIYKTFTDGANYERISVYSNASQHIIQSQAAGTGTNRPILIGGAAVNVNNVLAPNADSAYSLGQSGTRWSTTYTDGIVTDVETFTAASDTLDAKNNVALCDCTSNNITINLPAASTISGLQFHIKKIDSSSNTVTVDGNGSETIDGATTQVISNQYDSMTIVSDGSNWFIL